MKSEKGFIHLLIACEVVVLILVLIFGVVKQFGKKDEPVDYETSSQQVEMETEEVVQTETEMVAETETEAQEESVVFSEEVNAILTDMSLEQKVAQLFLVSPETLTNTERVTIAGRGTRTALTNYQVGGMLYAKGNYLGQMQMISLIDGAQEISQEVSGQYLFAAMLLETDSGKVIVISSDNNAETIATLINSNGNLETMEADAVFTIPLLEEITQTDAETLCCVAADSAEEAVLALQNGAELLCITENFESIYSAVLEAVNEGTIDAERIEQAVGKILTRKLAMIV